MRPYKGCTRVPTTSAVFESLKSNDPPLVPFGSFSDPCGYFGKPKMYTAWGFEDADYPIIETESSWDSVDGSQENLTCEYRLLCPRKQD